MSNVFLRPAPRGLREMVTTIASALLSEPVALVAFIVAFALVLLGGSVLMFAVKGGTMDVLLAADATTGPIERSALRVDVLRGASAFSLERYMAGCTRLFRPYLMLGIALCAAYVVMLAVPEQVEVLSLIGDVAVKDGEPQVHAHVVAGKSNGAAVGGHLMAAHVRPTLEVMLTESPEHLRRKFDAESGLALIDLA